MTWYYPLDLWKKALAVSELHGLSGLVLWLIWSLLVFFQTVSPMLMTIIPDVPTELNNANL